MFIQKSKIIIICLLTILVVSGCSVSFGSSKKQSITNPGFDGGVWVSSDKGDTWKQANIIKTVKEPQAISSLSSYNLIMDPSDSKALYFGSNTNGLFYTYNITEGWEKAVSFPEVAVISMAVDPKNKCIIYVTGKNKLYKSEDCSRTWSQVYFDDNVNIFLRSVAIDHHSTDTVYIGTSRGDVLKSNDRGGSWQLIFRDTSPIKQMNMSPFDSRILFVSTETKGIARSMDGGETWTNLVEGLKNFPNSNNFRDFEIAREKEGRIFLASTYGLLRSEDYGDTWVRIDIVTPQKESIINAIAINPKNSDEIYYATNTTFFRSIDGGATWSTIQLPTTRAAKTLLVSPDNPNVLYLGVFALTK